MSYTQIYAWQEQVIFQKKTQVDTHLHNISRRLNVLEKAPIKNKQRHLGKNHIEYLQTQILLLNSRAYTHRITFSCVNVLRILQLEIHVYFSAY